MKRDILLSFYKFRLRGAASDSNGAVDPAKSVHFRPSALLGSNGSYATAHVWRLEVFT